MPGGGSGSAVEGVVGGSEEGVLGGGDAEILDMLESAKLGGSTGRGGEVEVKQPKSGPVVILGVDEAYVDVDIARAAAARARRTLAGQDDEETMLLAGQ